MKNPLLLQSIKGEPIKRFPVWLMRQAGRYMPQYRELRNKAPDFLTFCKDVKLATEVSLLPLHLLGVDAIIIFSDILIPLEPMGVKVSFKDGEGPSLEWDGEVKNLRVPSFREVSFVGEIIEEVKRLQKEVPVIGFCGGPFTLASYIIEGGSSSTLKKTKTFMWNRKDEWEHLMNLLVETLTHYLVGQAKAGADVLQIFDTWISYLPFEDFENYKRWLLRLVMQVKEKTQVPIIYFFRGSSSFLEALEGEKLDAVSVDWTVDMIGWMKRAPHLTFQGNMDPSLLYCEEDVIIEKTRGLLQKVPRSTRYIFNLGHGLSPDMDLNKVKLLVNTVKSFSW
ncbi:uroporphyrinogen decarboxylase [Thermocrinis albus DSM 14484]|uniref:Uroporphyrinogen decarboxylase n=1 Tax=Thermocrinis albus (strain DSM 14484 / JCM 11386 / HI 11/12) TaxID=638303 RepID=D3SPU1_THEAH|nr:uroporphyrinogen decarboxylase [Thermocrinis albus]ADC89178.1 uroporphyrinogen decarboxylase [Thermocrinis albus DSM 14484]